MSNDTPSNNASLAAGLFWLLIILAGILIYNKSDNDVSDDNPSELWSEGKESVGRLLSFTKTVGNHADATKIMHKQYLSITSDEAHKCDEFVNASIPYTTKDGDQNNLTAFQFLREANFKKDSRVKCSQKLYEANSSLCNKPLSNLESWSGRDKAYIFCPDSVLASISPQYHKLPAGSTYYEFEESGKVVPLREGTAYFVTKRWIMPIDSIETMNEKQHNKGIWSLYICSYENSCYHLYFGSKESMKRNKSIIIDDIWGTSQE